MRGSAACVLDARSRSAAKFECSKALAPGPRFAHGSNINARDESCDKLKANGLCAKCLAAKMGQAERAKFLLRNCRIQPGRVSPKLGDWSFAGNGIRIHVNCTTFCSTIRREDFQMDCNGARSTRLEARLPPETLALIKRAVEIEGRSVSDFVVADRR
jgi:hypothetical protein